VPDRAAARTRSWHQPSRPLLPIKDNVPTRRFPIVTVALIVANFAVWIFYELPHLQSSVDELAFRPCEVEHTCRTIGAGWEITSVTSMFMHGSWLHILGNMLFLWIFGNNVEDRLGPILYFLFYIGAGIAATLGQLLVDTNSVVPNLGASGAIAGVLGAYLVMFPRRRVLTVIFFFFITAIWLPAWIVLGGWFILQLFSGIGSISAHVNSGVAFFAHIGGFVFGTLLALLFFPKESFGVRPPPPRPDFRSGRWMRGWGRGQAPPPPDEGWRPY
jgi:membrane associated rhomboid family serine protease